MKLIGRQVLHSFVEKHPDAKKWIEAWIVEVENSSWKTPIDITARYTSSSILPDKLVIFNVKGNKYRLVTRITYESHIVFVAWAGAHSDYSKIDFKR